MWSPRPFGAKSRLRQRRQHTELRKSRFSKLLELYYLCATALCRALIWPNMLHTTFHQSKYSTTDTTRHDWHFDILPNFGNREEELQELSNILPFINLSISHLFTLWHWHRTAAAPVHKGRRKDRGQGAGGASVHGSQGSRNTDKDGSGECAWTTSFLSSQARGKR